MLQLGDERGPASIQWPGPEPERFDRTQPANSHGDLSPFWVPTGPGTAPIMEL